MRNQLHGCQSTTPQLIGINHEFLLIVNCESYLYNIYNMKGEKI